MSKIVQIEPNYKRTKIDKKKVTKLKVESFLFFCSTINQIVQSTQYVVQQTLMMITVLKVKLENTLKTKVTNIFFEYSQT